MGKARVRPESAGIRRSRVGSRPDRSGTATDARLVEPYGLMGGGGKWYLMAWCRLRDGGRTFRLDRIEAARVTDEQAPERKLDEVAGHIATHLRNTILEP